MSSIKDRFIEDVGLKEGISRLTPEKIQKAFKRTLSAEAGARIKAYAEICMRCGLCSEACHFYVSHDGDPSYSPVGKVKQTMWEILKKDGLITPEELYGMAQIAYTECNLCRRCVHYCPVGIDTGYIMSMVRRLCHKVGVIP